MWRHLLHDVTNSLPPVLFKPIQQFDSRNIRSKSQLLLSSSQLTVIRETLSLLLRLWFMFMFMILLVAKRKIITWRCGVVYCFPWEIFSLLNYKSELWQSLWLFNLPSTFSTLCSQWEST